MVSLYKLLDNLIFLYSLAIIARVVVEWLVAFGIVNRYNKLIDRLGSFLYAITAPAFRAVHNILGRFVPLRFGGVDLAPLFIILLLWFARSLLREYWYLLIL